MTCIAGIEHDGQVTIGGDSAGVAGYAITQRSDTKVWTRDGWVYGFTTSFRMGQILRYRFNPPPVQTWDLDAHMATHFVDAVRAALRSNGWARADNGRDEGGQFLVGTLGRLYIVDSDFQIGRALDGYDAVGCGSDLALGALHATPGQPPAARITAALDAAAHHNAGVSAPFTLATA